MDVVPPGPHTADQTSNAEPAERTVFLPPLQHLDLAFFSCLATGAS